MIHAITCRNPEFLKTAYRLRFDLVNVEDEIPARAKYLTFDGRWRAWRMTRERVPIPLGAASSVLGAIYLTRR